MSFVPESHRESSVFADPQIAALRVPPHSVEAEQAVLGGLLLDNDAFDRVADVLREEAFYRHDHRLIWHQISRMIERGQPADVVTVLEALQSAGKAEEAGGLVYLNALAQETPSAANIRRYAEIVRDRAILRRLISTSDEIATNALNPLGRDTRQILDEAESRIFQISEEGARGQLGFQSLPDLLGKVVERIDELYNQDNPNDVTGVPTGFVDLDRMTSGLQPGDLIIVAGRPSMGKAQPIDARVRTRTGWTTIGELVVGDALASIDGRPSIVTGVFAQGERQVWRITFSDGRSAECCDEHLWRVHCDDWPQPRVLSLATLRTLLACKTIRGSTDLKCSNGAIASIASTDVPSRTSLPQGALWIDVPSGHFGHDEPLPIDPWLVGASIGEGLEAAGLWDAAADRLSIPRGYLDANRDARMRLLSGLLAHGVRDDDGHIVLVPALTERLARDIQELVRSLGGWCQIDADQTTGSAAHACSIVLPEAGLRPELISIEPSRRAITRCIAVSHPSRLYLTDDHVATHNTAFSLNIGEHVAVDQGLPVAVFSMEMGATQLAMRLVCSVGRLDQQRLRTGRLVDDDWPRLTNAMQKMQDTQLFIDETPALTALELRARARRLSRQCGRLGLIIVDYLQLMSGSSTGENRATEISEISRGLKSLAKELDCPVVALSQLNRSLEQRPNKRPVMSDLRECVTGETPVMLADGRRSPIRELVGTEPEVLAMDAGQRIVSARSDRIWSVGRRPVFRLLLANGRSLRATASHRLFSASGWRRLHALAPGDRLGIATAGSELSWDQIVSIEADGDDEVFDLTVPGPASWLADGIVSHNSGAIEQDADVILFIYRDEVYNPDSPEKGTAEIIIGKQRNGPIGTIRLTFVGHYTKFENFAGSVD